VIEKDKSKFQFHNY